jgi:hypothetical protein
MRFRVLVSLVIVFIMCLFPVHNASAHGRAPRLEISVERINPGGVLDIRGVEFDYEEVVTLYLERQGIVIQLGQIVADLEGIFIHTIVLPFDLPIGEYSIRGVTDHHDVVSPVLTVQGPAIQSEGGGQGLREEDDALLVPMPTYAPGVVPGRSAQSAAQPTPQTTALDLPVSKGSSSIYIYSILLGIGIIALAGIGILKKRWR